MEIKKIMKKIDIEVQFENDRQLTNSMNIESLKVRFSLTEEQMEVMK